MTNYITKTIKNGVEANIPVTSVNGQYGDVVVAGKEYNAGEGIEIGDVSTSDMQGPAPSGFHVPSKDEWVDLCGMLTTTFSMAKNATTMGTYLKIPMAGYRSDLTSNVSSQGSSGFYWSSTRYSENSAYSIFFYSSDIKPQNYETRSYALSVRCFKNSPVIPDNSWTTLYDGSSVATGAGVFRNSSLGLISVSGDGATWTTIQDKNLGATTVYNDGDTLSEANCGGYFQRGNNYMFPFTGTVTTSGDMVDASTYGPGNYYSSSTYITRSSSPYRWDSTDNGNLRGGVSQGSSTINNAITNTGVLSVNGQTGDISIESGGISNDTTGTTTAVTKVRGGTQAQYEALTTKDPNTLYFTTES